MATQPLPVSEDVSLRVTDPKRYVPVLGLLLTPVVLTGYVMAAWRLGADLDLFGEFFISKGLLSRWQVWLALTAAAHVAVRHLNKPVKNEETAQV